MASAPGVDIVARGRIEVRWAEPQGLGLDDATERAVNEVWTRAMARPGSGLHDSPILAFRRCEQSGSVSVIHGEYVPYRYYYARSELPNAVVPVWPIGVNGMTFVSEAAQRFLVLGRRSPAVSLYPGRWECVPSGGLDRRCAREDGSVDFTAMLVEEFEEELCLPGVNAKVGASFGFVYDQAAWTYDVCCTVEAACSKAELLEASKRSREYSELTLVGEDELDDVLERLGAKLIPTARAMIEMYGSKP